MEEKMRTKPDALNECIVLLRDAARACGKIYYADAQWPRDMRRAFQAMTAAGLFQFDRDADGRAFAFMPSA